ncbi:hypothetical protein [Magnetospirillum moscoviense]|uniref:Uncharacterized protein n=1 Tax=Magnetospirillum moscoviense TaxID=1437059 RepID=A0A178MXJ5_9PROT|nr:hypothetical protein [Magnetospirillum moscoviense]MBF0324717.1 hypothetical protein [Alphaproteobacteria bacterium]OAN54239.1 hypothetical protein A6A05_08685 [Magnetospirillum moscoviense]
MTCKICGAPTEGHDHCGEPCRLKLECLRIAWDRAARMVGVNGYYDRRYREHMRDHNSRGAKVMHKEWEAAKARLGERP